MKGIQEMKVNFKSMRKWGYSKFNYLQRKGMKQERMVKKIIVRAGVRAKVKAKEREA